MAKPRDFDDFRRFALTYHDLFMPLKQHWIADQRNTRRDDDDDNNEDDDDGEDKGEDDMMAMIILTIT